MTDDEIIDSLGKHADYNCDCCSTYCDNGECGDCSVYLTRCGLDLIKRQQEKISQLRDVIVAVKTERTWYQRLFETSRVEVIKEFAERLKQEGHIQLPPTGYPIDEDDWIVSKEDVDYIAAEMIGESYA